MKDHERFAIVMVFGSILAFAAGMATHRLEFFWSMSIVLVVEFIAIYLGWLWARGAR